MKTLMRVCLLFAPLAFLACAAEVEVPEVDLEAARAELAQTDLAFAAAAAEAADAELVASFWADEAVIIPPDSPEIRGKAAILEFVRESMALPGFSVYWEPVEVQVGPSGLVGYTIGPNRFTVPDEEGNIMTHDGTYVTVWQKQVDGSWKCVLDIWNHRPPADGAEG